MNIMESKNQTVAKYTEGPWVASEDSETGVSYIHASDPDGTAVLKVVNGTAADAELAAAAPDLLALAEAVAETCDDKGLRMKARAAIAKAQGA